MSPSRCIGPAARLDRLSVPLDPADVAEEPGDILAVPPTFVFTPTIDNYAALVVGEQRGQYSSTRPDFPRFFLNSIIISLGAVALSVAAGIPAAYALARFDFPGKNRLPSCC